ncbi:hemerythrin domain-containing protein [Nocardioides sp. SYSU D00038]|uniref:hemerythrin domain-containing protein n=1 Tax=Nocardioides sp. SYSU D00038 TaxID=2812554 RepID=UPI0019689EDA|nr:hemerythrin domain-containing protein [Nocardioides sp. SYSU D00038]
MSAVALLPGQAAAPEGPADLSMMYVLHHGFRRDLARFAEAARRTPDGDRATWRALLARWDLFATLLHDHHHKEDEILWPLLHERVTEAGDDRGAHVLAAMEAEHELIDPLLEAVRAGLSSLAERGAPLVRAGLVADLERARAELGSHLAHEERDAIALLQAYVGGEEWAHLERTRFRGGLSPRDLLKMLPWAVQGLPRSVVDPLLAEAGLPFRVLLRLGRRGYERLDRPAFTHVPDGVGA